MAKLPEKTQTIDLIYKHYESKQVDNGWREHLGASGIGKPCSRQLWYEFHWCTVKSFEGRLLRLFQRGFNEEAVFMNELNAIGVTAYDVDPETKEQFRFSKFGGHVGGSCDGAAIGFIEAPKTWHILEFKTASDKYHKQLCKKGVKEAKPEHYAQMQLYMGWSGQNRAFYLSVNKNDDSLYQERVKFDKDEYESLMVKAKRIVESDYPLDKIREDASYYVCNFCDQKEICHYDKVPAVNCRTCAHSTPRLDKGWHCRAHNKMLCKSEQIKGCGYHLFNPHLIPYAEMIDSDNNDKPGWIEYTKKDGGDIFRNVTPENKGPNCYTSNELHHADKDDVNDAGVEEIRKEFGATLIENNERNIT